MPIKRSRESVITKGVLSPSWLRRLERGSAGLFHARLTSAKKDDGA
jgi:hypothetical protein